MMRFKSLEMTHELFVDVVLAIIQFYVQQVKNGATNVAQVWLAAFPQSKTLYVPNSEDTLLLTFTL